MRKYVKQRLGMIASIVKAIGADGAWVLANFFCKGKLENLFSVFLVSWNIKWAWQQYRKCTNHIYELPDVMRSHFLKDLKSLYARIGTK